VQQTLQLGASNVYWCGNSCIVLTVGDKIALVGPAETVTVDIKSRSDGIYC